MRLAHAAAAAGVRPVFGVEVAVAVALYIPTGPAPHGRTPVRCGAHVVEAEHRITLLARNASGWARFAGSCRQRTSAPVDGAPVVGWPALQEYLAGEDLVVLLGPVSEPSRALSGC